MLSSSPPCSIGECFGLMSRGISDTGCDKSPRHLSVAIGAADIASFLKQHTYSPMPATGISMHLNFNSVRRHSERQRDQEKTRWPPTGTETESGGGHLRR